MERIGNFRVYRLQQTSSTNDEVKRRMKESAGDRVVAVSSFQTAGRGQKGNRWESEAGRNLLYSVGLRPQSLLSRESFILLQSASLAVVRILNRLGNNFTIKWPNDIYWKDRKLSGTLIENELCGRFVATSVVGTGINVNQKRFESCAPNPVSLYQILGYEIDTEKLLKAVLKEFDILYEAFIEGRCDDIRREYLAALYRRSGLHAYRDAQGDFMAAIAGIGRDGRLLLHTQQGELRRYAFKEVKHVLPQLTLY